MISGNGAIVRDRRAVTDSGEGLPNPLDPQRRIRAVLFDLDGTLYRQRPVRLQMALELARMPFDQPFSAFTRWQALRAYRAAHERLRAEPGSKRVAEAQLSRAAARSLMAPDAVEALVHEWMQVRPLKYLRRWRAPGVDELLTLFDAHGVRAGVLSDYPATAKLAALGLEGRFSPVLCSSDPDIDVLKPHPRGFLKACAVWHLSAKDVLMVGDRPDVDAAGADAAGMSSVIVGSAGHKNAKYLAVPSLERLHRVLVHR